MSMRYWKKPEIVEAELFVKEERDYNPDILATVVEAVPYGGESHSMMTPAGRVAIPDGTVICRQPGRIFVMPRAEFERQYEPYVDVGRLQERVDQLTIAHVMAYGELAPTLEMDAGDPVRGMRAIIDFVKEHLSGKDEVAVDQDRKPDEE